MGLSYLVSSFLPVQPSPPFNVSLGKGTSREHAPVARRGDSAPTKPQFNDGSYLKVYGKLFYMILTALLSVRKKLSVAQKYFKCNTVARLAFNVHA